MAQRRLLYLSFSPPFAPFSGYTYRTRALLEYLSNRFDVDVAYQASRTSSAVDHEPHCKPARVVCIAHQTSTRQRFRALLGPLPYHTALYSTPQMQDAVANQLRTHSYDALWINKGWHFPCVAPYLNTVPIFMDQIAGEEQTWNNLIANDPRPWVRAFSVINKRRVLTHERPFYRRLAGVICISPADLEETRRIHPGTPTSLVPQGVDMTYYKPTTGSPSRDTLIFCGTDATRNVEAMRWFIQHVMPIVHRSIPTMRLLWIGRVDPKGKPFLRKPWIDLTGFVEHVPEHFNRGAVFVSPFQMGEGMKTKLVEALAMEKVVVSTPIGLSGIAPDCGPFVTVADTPESFASSIITCYHNPGLPSLGAMARVYCARHYSWEHVLTPLSPFIDAQIERWQSSHRRTATS